jgi:hypothetical protein
MGGPAMELRRAGAKGLSIMVALFGLAVLPAGAGAYSKHCAHVRGYNDGTVTVRAMTCHRAAEILWQARGGRRNVSGFHCTIKGTGPGGGFPVWITCKRGRSAARGSVFDGPA